MLIKTIELEYEEGDHIINAAYKSVAMVPNNRQPEFFICMFLSSMIAPYCCSALASMRMFLLMFICH